MSSEHPRIRVLLVGAGGAAEHIGQAVMGSPHELIGIMARDPERAHALALSLGTVSHPWNTKVPVADLVLLAIPDGALAEVSGRLLVQGAVVAHCSGATGLNVLDGHQRRGVLWPVLSMSRGIPADLGSATIVVEGSDDESRTLLWEIARHIGGSVVDMDLEERRTLHLAAVFASNFPVFLMEQAQALLEKAGISVEHLLPLWTSMAHKVETSGPRSALTGPAVRNDQTTLAEHMDLLRDEPDLARTYELLSALIIKWHSDPSP
ncbi:MAG: DUF2520 domain-containing protein [Flavobacteriales bacterium]|nr:DUF2520 domain-containing protein [Flavobacteriales bacterium]